MPKKKLIFDTDRMARVPEAASLEDNVFFTKRGAEIVEQLSQEFLKKSGQWKLDAWKLRALDGYGWNRIWRALQKQGKKVGKLRIRNAVDEVNKFIKDRLRYGN